VALVRQVNGSASGAPQEIRIERRGRLRDNGGAMPATFLDRGALKRALIAPCGVNCGLCAGYLRVRDRCPGCRVMVGRHLCSIRECAQRGPKEKYCSSCPKYPCARIRHLDKRYRTRYGASMIANLQAIATGGINRFIAAEKKKWACRGCGKVLCMHRPSCVHCGAPRPTDGPTRG
jgi:hypothetical protein